MDGEGCVRWNKCAAIEVTNKHYGVLAQMQDRWGGRVRLKGEDVYVWTLYGRKALTYLSCIARYSIIKYPQIVALIGAARSTSALRQRYVRELARLKHVYSH